MSDAVSQLARLRAALTAAGDIVYDWDLASDEISWLDGTPPPLVLFGDQTEGNAQRFHDRIHPEDLKPRLDALSALNASNSNFECEFRLRDSDGEHHWYHDRGTAEFDDHGRPIRIRGSIRRINYQKAASERVQYLASYDELTGHFNKNRLRESLEHALYFADRYRVVGAFLVVGIDNINVVNQAFGYEVADAVIVSIGHRLDQCLRSCDSIGRMGGDCFGVVLTNCPADEVTVAAEKILETARNTEVDTPAGPIHVTVSVGAVVFPNVAKTATDAMTKADIALHNAKLPAATTGLFTATRKSSAKSIRRTWSLRSRSNAPCVTTA